MIHLLHYLKTLSARPNSRCSVVLLIPSSPAVASDPILAFADHSADLILEVSPLSTGAAISALY